MIYRSPPTHSSAIPASRSTGRPLTTRLNRSFGSSLKGYTSPVSYGLPRILLSISANCVWVSQLNNPGLQASYSNSGFFESSSTFSTPTRVQTGSASPLRYSRLTSTTSPLRGADGGLSSSTSFNTYKGSPLASYLGRHSTNSGSKFPRDISTSTLAGANFC